MPLIYHQQHDDYTQVGVWRGTESTLELQQTLPAQWIKRLPQHPQRQRETLSARNALRTLMPKSAAPVFAKDAAGKPYLVHLADTHFSLTHSNAAGAAVLSNRPCGIDLQVRVEKILRLRSKFERPDEREVVAAQADEVAALHILWGAKESLFKLWGRRLIDWREHLLVDAFDAEANSGSFTGRVVKPEAVLHADLHYVWLDDSCLVTATLAER